MEGAKPENPLITVACAICGETKDYRTGQASSLLALYKMVIGYRAFTPIGLDLWACNTCNAHMEAHHEGVPGIERK